MSDSTENPQSQAPTEVTDRRKQQAEAERNRFAEALKKVKPGTPKREAFSQANAEATKQRRQQTKAEQDRFAEATGEIIPGSPKHEALIDTLMSFQMRAQLLRVREEIKTGKDSKDDELRSDNRVLETRWALIENNIQRKRLMSIEYERESDQAYSQIADFRKRFELINPEFDGLLEIEEAIRFTLGRD